MGKFDQVSKIDNHFDIWQNQYNIVKFKNKIKLKKIDNHTF